MFKNPSLYAKFWTALVAPLGVLLFAMAPTETEAVFYVSPVEWYMVVVSLAAAIGVRRVPNKLA